MYILLESTNIDAENAMYRLGLADKFNVPYDKNDMSEFLKYLRDKKDIFLEVAGKKSFYDNFVEVYDTPENSGKVIVYTGKYSEFQFLPHKDTFDDLEKSGGKDVLATLYVNSIKNLSVLNDFILKHSITKPDIGNMRVANYEFIFYNKSGKVLFKDKNSAVPSIKEIVKRFNMVFKSKVQGESVFIGDITLKSDEDQQNFIFYKMIKNQDIAMYDYNESKALSDITRVTQSRKAGID